MKTVDLFDYFINEYNLYKLRKLIIKIFDTMTNSS